MKKIFFLVLVSIQFSMNCIGAHFYVGQDIPEFSADEEQILNDFGIQFRTLSSVRDIKKHNSEVTQLINRYGQKWRDTLNNKCTSFSEKSKKFLKHLFTVKNLDYLNFNKNNFKVSRSMTYHTNGMIQEYRVKKHLKENGGGMYHHQIKTLNWDQNGSQIKGAKKEYRGSA